MQKVSPPLVLIDGSSYLFRAFYALPNLTSATGFKTGAMLGVLNMLNKLIETFNPSHMAVVFDAKGKNFRHDLYPQYKANRTKMPEDLSMQIEPLHDLIRALGIPLIVEVGVEADDVIGSLAVAAAKAGQNVLISSGDKDMAQLVNEQVSVMDTMKDALYDVQGVKEKFGVWPNQMIDYLSLTGDVSDNIPGVDQVGPKTAVKYLEKYGNLENVLLHAEEIPGKIGENLCTARAHLPLSKKLLEIQCELKLSEHWFDLLKKPMQSEVLLPLLEKYELKSWLKKLALTLPNVKKAGEESLFAQYFCIQTEAQFADFLQKLAQVEEFALDTETTDLDEMKAKIVGLSFSWKVGEGFYLPLNHRGLDFSTQLSESLVLAALKPILASERTLKIGQNLKYDLKVLARYGLQLKGKLFDTMLASFILEAGQTRHDLGTLALRHLNRPTISYESLTGKGAKAINFAEVSVKEASVYASEDAEVTYHLYEVLSEKLAQTPTLKTVFETIEMPLIPVLAEVERYGVLIDAKKLRAQSVVMGEALAELEKQAWASVGQEFNLASPKQLQFILFEKMQIPILKKTPKGEASTAEEVLQDLAEHYELPSLILKHRHLSKLKSTYTEKLPQDVNSETGRIHTHYHQAGAATGRLSSSDPNLQNIPIRSEEGRQIRAAFIAPPGRVILSADYSQVELRIMAHFSRDESLCQAFLKGEDIHQTTASEVFDVPLDHVTSDLRRRAKAINFGLIYGMSPFGLAKQLNVGREEAARYLDRYFERYPRVRQFMESTRQQAEQWGYVETAFGRRLYLPDIHSRNSIAKKAAERAAINAPLQGTAADIIKKAMVSITLDIQGNPHLHLIMQVHDELVFEVDQNDVDTAKALIVQHMVNAGKPLSVPFKVDVEVGACWS